MRLADRPVSDDKLVVGTEELKGGVLKLSLGRKRHVLVRPGA